MQITDLIKDLLKIKEEYGDIEITINDCWDDGYYGRFVVPELDHCDNEMLVIKPTILLSKWECKQEELE